AMAAGAHYLDLADGRQFVTRFPYYVHPAAREAQRVAISGASSVPALSSAVIDSLSARLSQIEEIQIAIAPGQRAPRGEATVAAVLGYAGRRFKWRSGGAWRDAWGWQELKRMRFYGLGALGRRLRRSGPGALSEALSRHTHDGIPRFARNRRAAVRAVARRAVAPAGHGPADRALGEAARPDRLVDGRLRRRSRRHAGEPRRQAVRRKPRAGRMAPDGRRAARPRDSLHGRHSARAQARARR